jgi:hypothetical protein
LTTIAYDGKTVAADRLAALGGTPTLCCKVAKVDYEGEACIVAATGVSSECQAMLRWAKQGFKSDDKPKVTESTLLAFFEDSRIVWRWMDDRPQEMITLIESFWSDGSGADYALGAMAYGATAKEALEIATRLDINTGYGIDVLEF